MPASRAAQRTCPEGVAQQRLRVRLRHPQACAQGKGGAAEQRSRAPARRAGGQATVPQAPAAGRAARPPVSTERSRSPWDSGRSMKNLAGAMAPRQPRLRCAQPAAAGAWPLAVWLDGSAPGRAEGVVDDQQLRHAKALAAPAKRVGQHAHALLGGRGERLFQVGQLWRGSKRGGGVLQQWGRGRGCTGVLLTAWQRAGCCCCRGAGGRAGGAHHLVLAQLLPQVVDDQRELLLPAHLRRPGRSIRPRRPVASHGGGHMPVMRPPPRVNEPLFLVGGGRARRLLA